MKKMTKLPLINSVGYHCLVTSRRVMMAAMLLAVTSGLGGCSGQGRNFENDNDLLRKQNLLLEQQVRQLQQVIEQKVRLISQRDNQLRLADLPPGRQPPQLHKLRLGRYSTAIDTNQDGNDDTIRIYLHTLDQHNRFLPVSAKATLKAVYVADDNQPPRLLSEQAYDTPDFDKAYRSGITGTHYTLELKLPQPLPDQVDQITLFIFVRDVNQNIEKTLTHTLSLHRSTQP